MSLQSSNETQCSSAPSLGQFEAGGMIWEGLLGDIEGICMGRRSELVGLTLRVPPGWLSEGARIVDGFVAAGFAELQVRLLAGDGVPVVVAAEFRRLVREEVR